MYDIVLPLQLQLHSDSSCNRCTLWVANTECFRLILYYPFSCNPTVVWVAIDIHSELQILSASAWYYTTPSVATRQSLELQFIYTLSCKILSACAWYYTPLSVATRQWFELQSMYTLSCKYWVLLHDTIPPLQLKPNSGSSYNRCTLRVANTKCFRLILQQWFELQLIHTPSCKYWVLPPDTILPLQLQPNSGLRCNRCTFRVANTECFHLILYYLFRCNQIVVRVAIDVHSELQILIFQGFHLVRSLHRNCAHIHNSSWFRYIVATGLWYNLQFDLFDFFSLVHTFTCLVVLLQLAHGTCGNLVHFDFLLSKFNPRMCWKCAHTQ
jgi:hypothetical protein